MTENIRATEIGVTVMAVSFVGLRFLARKQRGGIWWDDHLIMIATLLHFVSLAFNLMMVDNGLGKQVEDVSPSNIAMLMKLLFAVNLVYIVCITLVKISILMMYCRMFPLRSFKIGAWILSTIAVLWLITFLFMNIFQCNPIEKAWNPMIPGSCLDLRKAFVGNAVPNIVTDAAILAMPMGQVWKLQVRLAQKITISCIFLLGCFVIFASIYRLLTVLDLDEENISYSLVRPTSWSHIEICAAIVSACLPTLRPLVMVFIKKLGSTVSRSSSNDRTDHTNTNTSEKPEPSGFDFWRKLRGTLLTIVGDEPDGDDNDGDNPRRERQHHRFQSMDFHQPDLESWPSSGKRTHSDGELSTDEVPLSPVTPVKL